MNNTHNDLPHDATDELADAANYLLSHIFPAKVFIGCNACHTLTCDCDSGVQAVRRLRDAWQRYVNTERGEDT